MALAICKFSACTEIRSTSVPTTTRTAGASVDVWLNNPIKVGMLLSAIEKNLSEALKSKNNPAAVADKGAPETQTRT